MTQEIDTNLFDQKVEVPEAIVGGKLAVEVVRQELIPVIRAARDMVVVDELSYQQAMALASECGRRSKKVEAEFAEAKEKTHAAWKAVTTLIASFTKPLDEARSMLNKKSIRWYDAEMARRKAEAERVRKEKEKADEDERLRLAEELAKNGNTKLADAVLEESTYIAPAPVEAPTVTGSTRVAKWTYEMIERNRANAHPDLSRVVVAIDPAVSSNEDSDETGIIAAGRDAQDPPHFYVLEDASGIYTPNQWAKAAIKVYLGRQADRMVAEVNNGGELVEANIRNENPDVSYTAVHASRGKVVRAEPISALYEQGRVHHVGAFPGLEDQMTEYDPLTSTKSPDRMDALVWALTELTDDSSTGILDYYRQQAKALKGKKA